MKFDEKNSNICITNYDSYIYSNEELPMKINNESSESQQSFYFSIQPIKL